MTNSISLLATGVVASLAAWAFWHFLGKDAAGAFVTIMLVVVVADNARLRGQLRARQRE
jgi:hypothetical protein